MQITVNSKLKKYSVHIQDHLLDHLSDFLDMEKRYIIISDDGVPDLYINQLKNQLHDYKIILFDQGESSKNINTYQKIINQLLEFSVDKNDCILGLGGGVVGDLSGYIASTYLRGIDYILLPTTLLSQVDSSIGGKTGINYLNFKNIIGCFYPPKKVLIDPQTLNTLSNRHFNNGIAEVIKYGLLASKDLLKILENQSIIKDIKQIIYQSLMIKKSYVELDEFDNLHRHFLNLGHTIGHAYESYYQFEKYLHGEAVALGLLKVIQNDLLKERIINLLIKYQLPIEDSLEMNKLIPFINKDKKKKTDELNLVIINKEEKPMIKNIHYSEVFSFIK